MKIDEGLALLLKEHDKVRAIREDLRKDLQALETVIGSYCKRNNICVHCSGVGSFCEPSSQETTICSACDGTGKY